MVDILLEPPIQKEVAPLPDSFRTYKDTLDPVFLSPSGQELVNREHEIPIDIGKDDSLRVKVVDKCGHGCVFCHNEGTKVNVQQQSYRVSVFETPDSFIAEPIEADEGFREEMERAIETFGLKEVHLTGGEPTQHPRLVEVIKMLSDMGLEVKMTSNGETGAGRFKEYAEAGLKSVSISIFGATAAEYAAVQHPSISREKWAAFKLKQSKEAIAAARENGITVKSNCVMSDASHAERIKSLIERAHNEGFSLRILNDLGNGDESIDAIYNLLAELGAEPIRRKLVAGASGAATYYRFPNGQEIGFKQIRKERLPETCKGCDLDKNGKCEEGYYGMRLYKRKKSSSDIPVEGEVLEPEIEYVMGVCIQRMDLAQPTDEFYKSVLPGEINTLREEDYKALLRYDKEVKNHRE